jgi:SNF2 family DNA or RNA helicase
MVRISAGYGRLYINGDDRRRALGLPGATPHPRTGAVQLSLTLESLRALRTRLEIDKQQMAALCTPDVLRWARAAGKMEQQVNALHARLATGWRKPFPWQDTEGNRPPFEHQVVMATVADELDGVAFVCEMGTGKTRAAVEVMHAKLNRGELDAVLVTCPKGVMGTWEREVRMWTGRTTVRLDGTVRARRAILEALNPLALRPGTPRIYILNFEALHDLKETIIALARRLKLGFVPDECHRIKNPQAQVTVAAMEIAQRVPWRLILGGTPVSNSALDVWSQWYVIDFGTTFGANYVQFRREFFDENPYTNVVTAHREALNEIGLRLRRRGLRYTKAECLNLPPKLYESREVEMAPDQRRAYEELEANLVAWLRAGAPVGEITRFMPADADEDIGPDWRQLNVGDKYATAANQLVAILRLTQITSGFVNTEDGSTHEFRTNPKLDALVEVIDANIDQQQIIVWARYSHDISQIMLHFRHLNPVRIDGSVTGRQRDEAERKFQAGESRLLVGNPAAGGVGLNLQAASLAIYYSQDYSLINRAQSEDRCHRSGSERHNRVTYIDMLCRGTIDETIRQALIEKKRVADVVVDLRRALGVEG